MISGKGVMDEKITNIVFGTGICLQNNWNLIIKHLIPEYCSDNSMEKWHTYPMADFPIGANIECIPPEKIKELSNPYVLITIGDPYIVKEVKKQMQAMDIPCVAIMDYLSQWGEVELFPKRLNILKDTVGKRRILMFNSPEHDNVGDHLISIAELQFMKKFFPENLCIEITDIEYLWHHKKIREYVRQEDILLITGGGFLGSMWLYNGESNVRSIIQEYPQNKVIIMPQTIYFEESSRGEQERVKTAEIYSKHPNLMVCLREKNSFQLMHRLLGKNVQIVLMPDMALFLDYSREQGLREDVLLCLRRDKESTLKKEHKEEILTSVEKCGLKYEYTLMHTGKSYNIRGREDEIQRKAVQMKAVKLVITDTLHAMILCAITGTPCLAYDNISHKVSGVYEWIKNVPYVHLYKQGEDVYACINQLVKQGAGHYDVKTLMSFYEKLSKMIGERLNGGYGNIKEIY